MSEDVLAINTCVRRIASHLGEVTDLLRRNEKAKAQIVAKDLHTEAATLRSLLEEKQ